ncbi:MAG: NAD(P)-dependent glycerol-3-phosphate dehydrogenase [Fimbriimonadaceae bacterium]|jgi:glycerol-3-phosphate dehydrogenase (NAD(P)+)|nr:NAD(P)-dependent glycerol-3-phosphate dehydrogenase [Fimbriimonadaceae bacterium]
MVVNVLGAGSWGTALSLVLARNGHDVILAGRPSDDLESLAQRRENLRYLPGFVLPESVLVRDIGDPLPQADFTVVAIPSQGVLEAIPLFSSAPIVVVASKGLADQGTGILSDLIETAMPNSKVSVLSGPNLARELAQGIPTAAVTACRDEVVAETVRSAFNCSTFRVYITEDIRGVEIAGALKNVMAIGAGMSDGLGFGDNTKGAFLSRGLNEMARLGVGLGARLETFLGLAGVGDLIATACSTLSRNYRVGKGLGQGKSLESVLEDIGQVAEGVATCKIGVSLARKHGIEVPLMETILAVIEGQIAPRSAVAKLMERQTQREGLTRASFSSE